ncbi:MAG: hypothetical protein JSS81_09115 [Acidobacteria bacterium]|nr:hypothetical protein [Acidobacteriota bacterium]
MILTVLLILLIILLYLLGVGLGIGFLLNWLFPSVELGIGIFIGVFAGAAAAFFTAKILSYSAEFREEIEERWMLSDLEELSEKLSSPAAVRKEKLASAARPSRRKKFDE